MARAQAALIDGEGTISITKSHFKEGYHSRPARRGFTWNARVHITNNNIPFLKRAQEIAGGTLIESHLQPSKKRKNAKPWSNLNFNTKEQRAVLDAVLPFLIVKKRHAELFLIARDLLERYRGLGPTMEFTDVHDKRMEAIYWELRLLNSRGRNGMERVNAELATLSEDPRLYTKEMFNIEIKQTEEDLEARKLIVRQKHSNKWKKNNADRVKKYAHEYYLKNKDQLKANKKPVPYTPERREYMRQYRLKKKQSLASA